MTEPTLMQTARTPDARRELWSQVIVGALACALTVSIVGSVAFLAIRSYRSRAYDARIQQFVQSLENRSAAELVHTTQELTKRPGVAKQLLPTLLATAEGRGPERRRLAAVQLCGAMVGSDDRVEKSLFALRLDRSEVVAAQAVEALASLKPPERAAEKLGECFADATPSVLDVLCYQLLNLGNEGRAVLRAHQAGFDVDRRRWLAGLLAERKPEDASSLLSPFATDPDAGVRISTAYALAQLGDATATESLGRLLRDREARVRHAAARGLSRAAGESFGADDAGVAAAEAWLARQPASTQAPRG